MDMKEFCQKLPKVELHAHLNGSLSENTLVALGVPIVHLKEYQLKDQFQDRIDKLTQCFKLFKVAHDATTTVESVYTATRHVIEEFSKDNCIYLEIRTTPRSEQGMTKKQYLEAVVRAIQNDKSPLLVKLTPSIDRRHSLKDSQNVLSIILEMRDKYPDIIKGIDLCGNPEEGTFDKDLFVKARQNQLKITLHCAEVRNDDEVLEMLQFKPDRIGHGTYIHPSYGGSELLWDKYLGCNIPLECCLTSNVLCGTTKGYKYHHVQAWKDNKLPFVLCTDDKGVFSTSLWEEYYHAAQHLEFTKDDLYECSVRAIKSSFASPEEQGKMELALL